MPNTLPIKRNHLQPHTTELSEPCEAHPLVIKELNSVTPSASLRSTSHWLTRLFTPQTKPALPQKIALAEVLAQNDYQHADSQAQEDSATRPWLKAGVALTLFTAAGALAWRLSRRPETEQATGMTAVNITDSPLILPAEPGFPHALALADYPAPALSSVRAAGTELKDVSRTIRDDLMIHFPGMQAAAIERLLIDPLAEMLVASAKGRNVSKTELAEQLTRLVDVVLSTLSIREHLQLYRRDRTVEDDAPFTARFFAQNGRSYVQLFQFAYPLRTMPDGTPFILTLDGRCHFIRYRQQAGSWEYVDEADNYAYSAQVREFYDLFRLRLVNLPNQLTMDYYPAHDYAGINSNGWIHSRGLFLAGNFFPVWSHGNVEGETYTNHGAQASGKRYLLVKGKYGWEFEPPSVRMDAGLKALLESKNRGVNNDWQKVIGSISEADGLCVDRYGKSWLKKDNKYFRAERQNSSLPDRSRIILPDYANAQAEYKNAVMQLTQADDLPFALQTTTVNNTILSGGSFIIEAAAVNYLQNNALTTTAAPHNELSRYHPGLAADDDYNTMLVVNDKKYAVQDYSKKYIRLHHKNLPEYGERDIFLWAAGNTLLRVRNSQPKIEYLPINAHDPTDSSKKAPDFLAKIETELDRRFKDFIDAGRHTPLSSNIKKTLKLAGQPFFWSASPADQDYFLYKDCYFPAMLIDASDRDNPLGHSYIDVFASKDFYSQQELIASLVVDVQLNGIEIKTASSFLAETLRTSKDIAALYWEHKPWSRFTDISSVAQAVNEVVARGRFHITSPGILATEQESLLWEDAWDRKQIINKLFSPGVNTSRLDIFKLTSDGHTLSPARQTIQEVVNGTLSFLTQEMLPRLIKSVDYDNPARSVLQPWLRLAIKGMTEELLSELIVEWHYQLRMMNERIKAEKLFIIHGEGIYLQQEEKQAGDRVVISPESGTIYVNAHKIDSNDKAQLRLIAELLSKAASNGEEGTLFKNILQTNGMFLPVRDSLQAIITNLKEQRLTAQERLQLQTISQYYLQTVPVYNQQMHTLLAPEKLAYLANYDPAYRANLFIHSPPLLSLLTLDSYFLFATNAKQFAGAEEWFKQYGAQRAINITLPLKQSTTNTSTSSTTTESHHHWHIPDHPHAPHKQRQRPDGADATDRETRAEEERRSDISSDEETRSDETRNSEPEQSEGSDRELSEASEETGDNVETDPDEPSETAQQTSDEESPDNSPHSSKEETSDDTQQTSLEESPDGTRQNSREDSPDNSPQTSRENSPDNSPQTSREDSPDNSPQTSREDSPDNSPQTSREDSPDNSPQTSGGGSPGSSRHSSLSAPDSFPGIAPGIVPHVIGQLAGYGAVAGAGAAVGLNAPYVPDVPDNRGMVVPRVNETTSTTRQKVNAAPSSMLARASASSPSSPGVTGTPYLSSTVATKVHGHQQGAKFLIKPEDQDKNKGEKFEPDSHDDLFIPNAPIGQGQTPSVKEARVYVAGHGNVLVIEIPELACLGEKDLTLATELRSIGQALLSPFTANALAHQEIEHVYIRGGDCPTVEDVAWMQDRASVFDAMFDLIMMSIPQLRVVFALRMLVGPTLLMIADDLEGKEISISDRIYYFLNAVLQIMSLFKIEVPTLKGAQRSSIFFKGVNKQTGNKQEKAPFGNRFSYIRDNEVYINIDGKEYPLHTTYDEAPMIEYESGRSRIIKFNMEKNRWEFEEDIEQSIRDENKRNQNKFKMPLAELPRDTTIWAGDNEIFTIKITGKPEMTGVFTELDFIPARQVNIGAEIVAYTASESVPLQDQRLLIHGDAGWSFERSSAKMDRYLKILIDSKQDKGSDYSHNKFGAMRKTDGVSHDPHGGSYIKKDYKYYRVEKIDTQNEEITYKLPEYSGGVIKYKKGYFILEGGTDILYPAKTELIREKETTFRIESDALAYLHSHALDTDDNFFSRIGPGIYSMPGRPNKGFVVNKDRFTVTFFEDREMHIKRKNVYGFGPDIKLWLDKNTWYRIRDYAPEPQFEFENLGVCRFTRSPGVGRSCPGASIMIETELSKKLIQELHNGNAPDNVPSRERLVEVRSGDIPYLYQDTETLKYYYKFSNNYFNAKIIEASDVHENPTGFPYLIVTGRSDFYTAEKNIATIVMYDDGNSIKMVDLSTFIAQKLNIGLKEATIYNKKSIFKDMEYIEFFEKLTSETQLADDLYVEQPGEIPAVPEYDLTGSRLEEAAKKSLFPENILKDDNYSILIYDLDTPAEKSNVYIQDSIKFVKRNLDYLRQSMLPRVMNSFSLTHYNHPITEDYLIEIFKKDNAEFIKQAQLSFFLRLVKAKDELNYRKIKIMTVVDNKNNQHPRYSGKTKQAVFIGDKEHIYVNIDLLDVGENSNYFHTQEFTGATLSAALSASGKSAHIIDIPRKEGVFVNIKDAYRALRSAVRTSTLNAENVTRMREIITRYVSNSPLHREHLNNFSTMLTDWRKFNYLLRFDPGLRTQLTLNSDDLLTLVTQDINYLISSTEQEVAMLHPWVKKYGKTRGALNVAPAQLQMTDAMTSRTVDLASLTLSHAVETITRELPGSKNIYTTTEGKIRYKWQDNYYPLEFFGPSGMLASVGSTNDIRQVYYYDPVTGELSPLQNSYSRSNVITYDSGLDIYTCTAPAADYSAVLKFNKNNDLLMLTGANRVTHLPGKVSRIEYPWFNLYHPEGASHDIYIQGQGKVLPHKTTLPDNIKITYYTNKGRQLLPYPGDTEALLSNRFSAREMINPGEDLEDYIITPMIDKYINHYRMARTFNKNIIQLRIKTINLASLIEAASKLFLDDEINVHLYMGRADEGQHLLPRPPGKTSPQLNRVVNPYESAVARWAFDQQVTGGAVQPDKVLQGFLPLKETHVYLHYATTHELARLTINYFLRELPYNIYYGLDIDSPQVSNVPTYIKDVRVQASRNMAKAQKSLEAAWLKLNTPTYQQSIYNYFAFAFDLNDGAILDQIFSRFRTNVSRVRNFLIESSETDYENIGVVSTIQTPNPKLPGLYMSALTDPNSLKNIPSAFIIPGDAYRRIYIMADSYPNMEISQKNYDINEMKMAHVLTHEASHLAANTYDITYIIADEVDFTEDGLNIQDAQRGLRQINQKLDSNNFKASAIWGDFVPALYRYLGLEIPDDEAEVVKLIKDSPMIKANLVMTNADSFAVFVKHVSNLDTDGRDKREIDEKDTLKHLGLLFACAREHHIIDLL